ncbi:MAG: protein-methionine-sulfoxide reductase catalytic subunit MsrP [Hydrogenophaga sp.]|uniref:protein-methionine-sulfoxide reductase catalytic subunit MsrP n=1 Tax=Hydrogenophaga sp. TaxID=1904254 RepID=UPI002723A80C|nr:protein-methionine-sulfoxide reductase catalytic subunit MsrP [Hydrogenophaga sp.]MDO9147289.1 protein-methionine-sulfoxide reductase catalytic subunit MsrP [Hydrogenophaga sp.]MDO9604173.1 protein-methionine-sulfoxide reductase catalytic subunit MsrP [Hydrogenophaga sp.]MDP2164918.1 protein-methionine-sulfoxide reductase catalytic subunit MsrP [Hydrogenophaga sp.]MDP3477910.1 protein-methionine-sulfoxide reductase catalytic subunit MsrP [Hydrogenophaga sp.]
MIIRPNLDGFQHPVASEITSHADYVGRRAWLQRLALGAGGAVLASWASREAMAQAATVRPGRHAALGSTRSTVAGAGTVETVTTYDNASTYNNFYEFGTDKSDPAAYAKSLKTSPWTVSVEGLINKPRTYGLEELLKLAPMEERIYRLRCVEGWSMVIPWVGYSLGSLIKQVQPQGSAKYVEFVTQADPKTMRGLASGSLDWPYTEGLRMDEALHPLTLLAFGMYGEVLPNQNGAPLRLVVPWKYGFKSGKSLVKIRFTDKEPRTAWNVAAPQEYGFYSNVNPDVSHPRWSQSTERRIGEEGGLFAKRRKTLLFNGYAQQVGQLYAGMDLRKLF